MKRVLALVLAVCMLVVFLPACGSSTPQPAPETPKAQTAEDLGVDLSKEVVGGQKGRRVQLCHRLRRCPPVL